MSEKSGHMPTIRVILIFEAIAASPIGLTFTEITESTGVAKSSLFPIVHTLVDKKYLYYDPASSKYTLGLKIFETGNCFLNQFDILEYVKEQMRSIVSICNETCHFAVLSNSDVLYIDKVDSSEPIRMYSSIGKRLPAYGTGLGKALLCMHSPAEIQRLYPDGLKPLTQHTITDFGKLNEQLKEIRKTGVAYEKEESNLQIQCIAVPILKNEKPVFALSVAIPVFRATKESLDVIEKLLVSAKKNIEQMASVADIPLSPLF